MEGDYTSMEDKNCIDPKLLAKIQQKKKERQERFVILKKQYKIDDSAQAILCLSVNDLLARLKAKEISARQVLSAYIAKSLEITEKFNCITEFIPQATKWASHLDVLMSDVSYVAGPLHGFPIAVKDDHDVEGMDTTLGYAKNVYKPATESAAIVQVLMRQGAVPFVKTNVPQSLFSGGSDNPIFGTTLNSLNPELGPGGSSSGSACLVAAGGAIIGTGTDTGGSLRIPAHCHGLSTVKPTINRLSDKGILQCLPKLVGIRGAPGVIARDVKTLVLVWKAITKENVQNEADPVTVPIPWNDTLFMSSKKLKIGYFESLPTFPAFEDVRQAVLSAKDALVSRGHHLVPFSMPDDSHYVKVIFDCFMADRGKCLKELFTGEPISYCVASLVNEARGCGQDRQSNESDPKRDLISSAYGGKEKSAKDLWDIMHEKRMITRDILDRMKKADVDLILSPAMPFPAVKLQDAHRLSGGAYMSIWNFVDFPAGVCRFSMESGLNIASYEDCGNPTLILAKNAASKSAGIPLNVQIIGKPYQEELVLRAMMELEDAKESLD